MLKTSNKPSRATRGARIRFELAQELIICERGTLLTLDSDAGSRVGLALRVFGTELVKGELRKKPVRRARHECLLSNCAGVFVPLSLWPRGQTSGAATLRSRLWLGAR